MSAASDDCDRIMQDLKDLLDRWDPPMPPDVLDLNQIAATCCMVQRDREVRTFLYHAAAEFEMSPEELLDSINRSIGPLAGFKPPEPEPADNRRPRKIRLKG